MDFLTRPVLTVDIVGFSLLDNVRQVNAITKLIELIRLALPSHENRPTRRLWSPGGDGGSMTFLEDSQGAIATAVTLSKLMAQHNRAASERDRFYVRMGLHSGPVTRAEDFDGRENIWGEGINMATRVAAQAKAGQILASKEFYDDVQLFTWPADEVTSVGRWWVKHGRSMELYNVYKKDEDVGIPLDEVDMWYGPFQGPLAQALQMYEAMLIDQARTGPAFRVAVLAKRLMDLDPKNESARHHLGLISILQNRRGGSVHLHDRFFSPLTSGAVRYFFQHAHFHTYRKGSTVVTDNELADSMMLVVSGEMQIPNTDITFKEGTIVGEMALFSPERRRTATLVATKNTVTLVLDYKWLKLEHAQVASGQTELPNELHKKEIRNQIWKSYCVRIAENQINLHPLFQHLPSAHRNDLLEASRFLPAEHGQAITLSREEAWRHWTIVVAGEVTLYSLANHQSITYKKDDCVGLAHLELAECPFSWAEVSADAHLVCIPWSTIKELALVKGPPSLFVADWYEAARLDRQRFTFSK